jgi:hypothetical protein
MSIESRLETLDKLWDVEREIFNALCEDAVDEAIDRLEDKHGDIGAEKREQIRRRVLGDKVGR